MLRGVAVFFASLATLVFSSMSDAQHAPQAPQPIAAPDREKIPLAGEGGAGENWEQFGDQYTVRNVTEGALYPVLPPKGARNGRAVIVVPGGGYRFVSMDSEGFRVADRLAAEGYSVFVLKYRVVATSLVQEEYMAQLAEIFGNLGKGEIENLPPAVDDLVAAASFIQARADEWGIDPAAINIIGFSAGARTLVRYLERGDAAPQLQSAALLYPPMTQTIGEGARPPLFVGIAVNDPLFKQGGLNLVEKWLSETGVIEFHLYSGGNHGFGMRPMGATSDKWIDHYINWLDIAGE